jgi:hypothetical protein
MGMNFPNAPTTNQLYPQPAVAGQPVYRWDGQKWVTQGAAPTKTPVYIDGSTPMAAQLKLFGSPPVATNDAVPKSYVDGLAVRYDQAQGLTSAQQTQARANIGVTQKNYLINGSMQISQENGATAGSVNGYYAADQWMLNYILSAGSVTFAQNATITPSGSPKRLRLTVTGVNAAPAAGDYLIIVHKLEGLRIADLAFGTSAASAITLQFGVRVPAGTYSVEFSNGVNANRVYIASFTISAGQANIDTIVSLTIPGDTAGTWAADNTASFYLYWSVMCGSTNQAAAGGWYSGSAIGVTGQSNLMAVNGQIFDLFDVGLYKGTAAPSFQVLDYSESLRNCQRYYAKFSILDLYVADVASYSMDITHLYPVTMRASPTLSGAASSTSNLSGFNFISNDNTSMYLNMSGAAGPANTSWQGTITANARM